MLIGHVYDGIMTQLQLDAQKEQQFLFAMSYQRQNSGFATEQLSLLRHEKKNMVNIKR